MSEKARSLTQIQKKLINHFENIKDENIREIIRRTISLESRYRSSDQFPLRELRDIVDSVAHRIESKEGKD